MTRHDNNFGFKIHGYVKHLPLSTLPAIVSSPVGMRSKPVLPRWQATHQTAPAHSASQHEGSTQGNSDTPA